VWAKRAIRAHQNAIENLMIFAPAVLIAHELNISTPVTRAAAAAYFAARLLHFIVYTAGVPLMRTLTFTVGWIAQLCILASILGWM
jgi:Predicted membrane protein